MSIKQLIKTNLVAVAALVIALTTMSFKLAEKSNEVAGDDDLVWFRIDGNYNLTAPVMQADAHYLNTGAEPDDEGITCAATGTKQCVSGFTSGQVNASNQLKDNSQVPLEKPGRKS